MKYFRADYTRIARIFCLTVSAYVVLILNKYIIQRCWSAIEDDFKLKPWPQTQTIIAKSLHNQYQVETVHKTRSEESAEATHAQLLSKCSSLVVFERGALLES